MQVLDTIHIPNDFLRGRHGFAAGITSTDRWRWLLAIILIFGPLYGLSMGSFSATEPARWLLSVYSAIKVPLLLGTTTLICLPGYFVLNTVLGLRDDFRAALQAILAGQAALAIALASLAPLTLVWYASDVSYRAALLFNAGAFLIATLAGQAVMLRYYRPLIARDARHRLGLAAWLGLYAFVGIQMGWMLRPFIGAPGEPPQFFRPEPFTNAYVVVARLLTGS